MLALDRPKEASFPDKITVVSTTTLHTVANEVLTTTLPNYRRFLFVLVVNAFVLVLRSVKCVGVQEYEISLNGEFHRKLLFLHIPLQNVLHFTVLFTSKKKIPRCSESPSQNSKFP